MRAPPAPDGDRGIMRRHGQLIGLSCWSLLWFVILAPDGGGAWRFFQIGARLMFSGPFGTHFRAPGGLHMYANYPWLQIGPLAFAVAEIIRHLGPDRGLVAAQLIMTMLGLAALAVIRQIALAARPELAAQRAFRQSFLGGGAIFMIGWTELAVAYGHLDDALALLLAVLALLAAVHGSPVLAGLAIGLAIDAKPWALIFLPVLLLAGGVRARSGADLMAPPASGRPASGRPASGRPASGRPGVWILAACCAAVVVAAGWLPFFLADPGTAAAMHYTIVNLPDSALRAMGVATARTPPWDRPAQIIAGCGLAALAIWRRRWPAVILLGVGARIALDPAAHGYYTPGVLAGALLWDLAGARRPFPLWTALSFCALNVVPLLTASGPVRGAMRLLLVVAFSLALLLGPDRWYAQPGAPAAPSGAGDQHAATATPSMPGPV